jgi:hypothetical protein
MPFAVHRCSFDPHGGRSPFGRLGATGGTARLAALGITVVGPPGRQSNVFSQSSLRTRAALEAQFAVASSQSTASADATPAGFVSTLLGFPESLGGNGCVCGPAVWAPWGMQRVGPMARCARVACAGWLACTAARKIAKRAWRAPSLTWPCRTRPSPPAPARTAQARMPLAAPCSS